MKCRETHYWLYSLRPNTSWPVDVVTHLQGCDKCRALQTRLKQIDQEIIKLTSAASDPVPQERLLALIDKTPQMPAPAQPGSAPPWLRFGGYLVGVAALLLFGWFLGQQRDSLDPVPKQSNETVRVVEVFRDKIVNVDSQTDRNLFAALLKRNARLVQAVQVMDRLDALLGMAEDCRQHALTLIDQGPRDSLPFTIDLYTQLLRDGVVVQVQQAPMESRPMLKATVRTRLEKMSEPAAAPKALPKVVEDQRAALQSATRQTLDLVDRPAVAPLKTEPRSGPVAPAAALVQFAIAFSSETEPVAKADSCSTCVNRLLPFMMLCLAEDGTPERADMGQQFGEMIQFGIYTPLASVAAKAPTQPVKDQAERIIETTFQAVFQMEKNLEVAPEAAKAAMERMLEATKKGKHGKGPPWLRDPIEKVDPQAPPGKGKSGNPGKNQKKAGPERFPGSHALAWEREKLALRQVCGFWSKPWGEVLRTPGLACAFPHDWWRAEKLT